MVAVLAYHTLTQGALLCEALPLLFVRCALLNNLYLIAQYANGLNFFFFFELDYQKIGTSIHNKCSDIS